MVYVILYISPLFENLQTQFKINSKLLTDNQMFSIGIDTTDGNGGLKPKMVTLILITPQCGFVNKFGVEIYIKGFCVYCKLVNMESAWFYTQN